MAGVPCNMSSYMCLLSPGHSRPQASPPPPPLLQRSPPPPQRSPPPPPPPPPLGVAARGASAARTPHAPSCCDHGTVGVLQCWAVQTDARGVHPHCANQEWCRERRRLCVPRDTHAVGQCGPASLAGPAWWGRQAGPQACFVLECSVHLLMSCGRHCRRRRRRRALRRRRRRRCPALRCASQPLSLTTATAADARSCAAPRTRCASSVRLQRPQRACMLPLPGCLGPPFQAHAVGSIVGQRPLRCMRPGPTLGCS